MGAGDQRGCTIGLAVGSIGAACTSRFIVGISGDYARSTSTVWIGDPKVLLGESLETALQKSTELHDVNGSLAFDGAYIQRIDGRVVAGLKVTAGGNYSRAASAAPQKVTKCSATTSGDTKTENCADILTIASKPTPAWDLAGKARLFLARENVDHSQVLAVALGFDGSKLSAGDRTATLVAAIGVAGGEIAAPSPGADGPPKVGKTGTLDVQFSKEMTGPTPPGREGAFENWTISVMLGGAL